MMFASYKLLLFLYCYWSLTMASDNFNEIKIQQLEGSFFRISCGIIKGPLNIHPIQLSIFVDTPNNTLVTVVYRKCPNIQASAKDKHIYLPKCVPDEENTLLEIVLTNYNPIGNEQFGCDYLYLVEPGQIFHSVSLATISSPEKSSPAASNETETPTPLEDYTEVIADTPSSIVRDDTSIDHHGGTWGTPIIVLLIIAVLEGVVILLIIRHKCKGCYKINCRRVSTSGKAVQAEINTLEYGEHDEHEVTEYTEIDKPVKHVNYDDVTEVNEANSSPAIAIDNEGYPDDKPYFTQVRKLPVSETCVHNLLMD